MHNPWIEHTCHMYEFFHEEPVISAFASFQTTSKAVQAGHFNRPWSSISAPDLIMLQSIIFPDSKINFYFNKIFSIILGPFINFVGFFFKVMYGEFEYFVYNVQSLLQHFFI